MSMLTEEKMKKKDVTWDLGMLGEEVATNTAQSCKDCLLQFSTDLEPHGSRVKLRDGVDNNSCSYFPYQLDQFNKSHVLCSTQTYCHIQHTSIPFEH